MQRLLQLQRGKRRNRDVRREEAHERASERERGGRERTDRRTNIKSFVSPTTSDILCVFFVDRKDDPNKGHSFCISLKLIRYIASRSFIAFFTIAAIFEGRIRNLTPSDLFFFFFFLLFFLVLFMSDTWCDFDRIFGLLNWSTPRPALLFRGWNCIISVKRTPVETTCKNEIQPPRYKPDIFLRLRYLLGKYF